MCGIAGFFRFDSRPQSSDEQHLIAVRDHMLPRGPDSAGIWLSPDRRVGLANRRLAIQDLSEAGNQPMFSPDGNLIVVFNGEIYNYPQLRRELEAKGVIFRSNCDTEILLHLYQLEGSNFPNRLRGMFAFAIFDLDKQELFLARDHFGQKPLYFSQFNGTFWFASQVKALLCNPEIPRTPDPAGHVGFFLWGNVPAPFTLYESIREIAAGTTVTVRVGVRPKETRFFSISSEIVSTPPTRVTNPHEAREILRASITDSVKSHLLADVPVGLFLSAGIDSTVISGLASIEPGHNLRCLTLGFREFIGTPGDETILAQKSAKAFNLPHWTSWVSRKEFFDDLNLFFRSMDQPTVDGINVFLISRAAAQQGMKVAISGLGGDELFGSYPSFTQVPLTVRFLAPFRHIPWFGKGLRRILSPFSSRLTSPKWASLIEMGSTFMHAFFLRRGLFMPWEIDSILDPDLLQIGLQRLHKKDCEIENLEKIHDPFLKVMKLEMHRYMKQQLLRDADWAGMAYSLEIRAPLVDLPLFRTIVGLRKGGMGQGKRDLGQLVADHLPPRFLTRPKSGFMVPVIEWIIAGAKGASIGQGLRSWSECVYQECGKE